MSQSTKAEWRLNGKKLHLKFYNSSIHSYLIYSTFKSQEIFERENLCSIWDLTCEPYTMFYHLQKSFNQKFQPFISALYCCRWWNTENEDSVYHKMKNLYWHQNQDSIHKSPLFYILWNMKGITQATRI